MPETNEHLLQGKPPIPLTNESAQDQLDRAFDLQLRGVYTIYQTKELLWRLGLKTVWSLNDSNKLRDLVYTNETIEGAVTYFVGRIQTAVLAVSKQPTPITPSVPGGH